MVKEDTINLDVPNCSVEVLTASCTHPPCVTRTGVLLNSALCL